MLKIRTEHHTIGGREDPPYLIAEIGLNHNGDLDLARRMADAARASGAHAAKFQLYRSREFIHSAARLGDGPPGSLAAFFEQFELSPAEWHRLAAHVRDLGLDFFCSVFDSASLRFYTELEARLIKIASCDIDNRMLFEEIAATGDWAVLFSAGTATEAEVERAVSYLEPRRPRIIFECVSAYPAEPGDYNLAVLQRWRKRYGYAVGISDHTMGNGLSVGAVALGARAVERHFTLDRSLPGPDQAISLEPADFRGMADEIAACFAARGGGPKVPAAAEEAPRTLGRRALYARHPIAAGRSLTREDLVARRPGGGFSPNDYIDLIGGRFRRDIAADEVLRMDPVPTPERDDR
jgi:sialic acid synthase SpsE